MAKKKHHRTPHKPQKPRKKQHHLPKVGSPDQHRWDESARDGVVGDAGKWAIGAILIIAVIAVLLYFF